MLRWVLFARLMSSGLRRDTYPTSQAPVRLEKDEKRYVFSNTEEDSSGSMAEIFFLKRVEMRFLSFSFHSNRSLFARD